MSRCGDARPNPAGPWDSGIKCGQSGPGLGWSSVESSEVRRVCFELCSTVNIDI